MKQGIIRAVAYAILAFAVSGTGIRAASLGDAPKLPRKATPFGVQTAPNKYIWLNEYEGKTCVIAFILTTCPHCQFTTGILNKLQAEFANQGVQIIESAAEPMAALHVADFQSKFHPAFPVGYNDQRYIAKFLGYSEDTPMMFPTIAIIDKSGMIRVEIPGDDNSMEKSIQEKSLREAIVKTMGSGQAAHRTPAPK